MLEVLHRIVQEVNGAANLEAALEVIVTRVKGAIGADVCSVYLTNFEERTHVLMATDGLRKESVGKVRLPMGRGLVGLVTERAEPVNEADAPAHPRYLKITDTGETQFHGFLGVPIIQNRKVLGVLVVRQVEPRQFGDAEVTFLFTLAAQLAGAIVFAQASGELAALQQPGERFGRFLQGRPGSPGVGLGTMVVAYRLADLDAVPDRRTENTAAESHAFRAAVAAVEDDLRRLKGNLSEDLPAEDRALFDALLLMLGSDTLVTRTIALIEQGNWAPGALRQTIQEHARVFDAMEDVYLRERASDIRDLGRRILMHLQRDTPRVVEYPARTILVGEEVTAMQLAEVPKERLAGIVSASGSSSSHVAIFARAIGLPAVMGITGLPVGRVERLEAIIDGYRGRVYANPEPAVRAEYERLALEEQALSRELEHLRGLPAETTDGLRVPLYLNTGLVNEMLTLGTEEAEGIGLYRTEMPFMVRDRFPGESVQVANYRNVIKTFAPRPVILRTLDVGGDKPLPYFPVSESNPFLGWRGVRISLSHPEIFLTQVRAMLRAAIGFQNLRILLPMVSTVAEVEDLQQLIQRAHDELLEEGYAITKPGIGVMVEVPSAVYLAEDIARRVDFLSIGTNDLTQYILAVDRNNPHVADLYDDMHPAVLRAVQQVIEGSKVYSRPVSVCGELAGNPLAAVLLVGMGVESLSMSVGSLLKVKWVIRSFSKSRARQLAQVALRMEDARQVRRFMDGVLAEMGLAGLVGPAGTH
ncbi:MAG: phosphoenolpyruvate--protein phosphotransferase [Gammaproteobacteria bacterium]|jgi:phosphotransferase system enzyme I (PtsP)|nr:phosphoenolpyruvate--protein phosphotransferase [Gammaproteobacteria bacterium]